MHWPQPVVAWLTKQWQRRGVWYWLTLPLSWLYATIIRLNAWSYACRLRQRSQLTVPVIVVGNLYIGGTGKTPVTIALAHALTASGYKPGLISRGYGSHHKKMPATDQGMALDPLAFGDEPALIARRTLIPISVHANRFLAGRQLLKRFPDVDVIISDDGLQHQKLARDIEFLVEDDRGVGNGATLPAGPLRETRTRRSGVDAILRRGSQAKSEDSPLLIPTFDFDVVLEHFYCPASDHKVSVQAMAQKLLTDTANGSRTVAIAGIGVPERFFQVLRKHQIRLDGTVALSDHAPITDALLASIDAATILVTEKDAVKYPVQRDPRIWVASANVQWSNNQIMGWLKPKLDALGTGKPAAIN